VTIASRILGSLAIVGGLIMAAAIIIPQFWNGTFFPGDEFRLWPFWAFGLGLVVTLVSLFARRIVNIHTSDYRDH